MSDPTNPGTPPSVTTLGPFPSRTAAEDTYDAEMDTALDTLEDFPDEQNAVTAWQEEALEYAEFIQSELETLQTDVNTSTGANVTAAEEAQTAAETARDIAEGFANYQGDYDAGTLYAIGESVTYNGLVYVKKSAAAAGTTPVDGADWRAYEVAPDYEEFTSSGTWTKPAGVTWVYVEAVGGGGGGGNWTGSDNAGGGGGGAGTFGRFLASDVGATETVTIGAGGAGGANGVNGTGSDGGDTSFGSLLVAPGGKKGAGDAVDLSAFDETCFGGGGEGPVYNSSSSFAGGGGFSSGCGGIGQIGWGGNCILGGGGGGGVNLSLSHPGGISQRGGNGGAGNAAASTKGGDGSAPGGGGGASSNNGGGGDGGDGRVRVWAW